MTLAANRQSVEFNELKHDKCDDVDDVVTPLSLNRKNGVVLKKIEILKNVFGKKRSFTRWFLGRCFVVSEFMNTRYNTRTADTCGGKENASEGLLD